MKLKFDYLDSLLEIDDDTVISLEINNKGYFYRTVNNFLTLNNGDIPSEIFISNDDLEEINLSNKIFVVIDYFNFDLLFSKYNNSIIKLIAEDVNDDNRLKLVNNYKKMIDNFNSVFTNIDLPIQFNKDFSIEQIIKFLKPSIILKESLLENLLLLIDLEKSLNIHKVIVFINLKQFLTKEELIELYKYSIYNKINVILIDSQCYGPTIVNYEKKLIVDENLEEIML